MSEKEKDKRLIIPKDAFEEEASEGLGRLSREEAEADLRELKGRMERRLRKPRMIWLPAAAAVVMLLVASALYVSIFRDRSTGLSDLAGAEEAMADSSLIAMAEDAKADTDLAALTDTLMIAMAVPIETKGGLSAGASARREAAGARTAITVAEADEEAEELLAVAEDAKKKVAAAEVSEVVVMEAQHEEPMAEEVIVAAVPMMQKAGLRSDDALKERAAARPAAAGQEAGVQGAVMPDREASPVGGWEEFREWMARNIRYPEGVDSVERKVIVVSFRVRADSTVYDLKAERTAGDLFTREAFRLIREGPKWQPAVRGGQATEEVVKVSIVFR
jgi:hypothetical protein